MWQIVFDSSIPFVFQTPYQSKPLDLYSPFFYLNRQPQIDAFLADILAEKIDAADILRQNYLENYQCISPGVAWESYSVDLLCEVVNAFENRKCLTQLLLYGCKDYRSFGKGMPDLCMWKKEGGVLVSEVKGPRDRLSPEQEAHLIMLNQMGIKAIVTHVKEAKEEEEDNDDDDVEEEGEEGEEEEEESD
jgi:Fanconi-associated nuclease 1